MRGLDPRILFSEVIARRHVNLLPQGSIAMLSFDGTSGPTGQMLRQDPCGLLYRMAVERPGETALLGLGNEQLLIFQDAAAFRRVLRENPNNYCKNFGSFAAYFGRSRLTSDGERWRYLQRLTQPLLAGIDPSAVTSTTVEAYTNAAAGMLAQSRDNKPLIIDSYLDAAAARVVFEAALGLDPSQLAGDFFADLRTLLRFAGVITWNLPGAVIPPETQTAQEAQGALSRVRQTLVRLAEANRRKPVDDRSTFLHALLTAEADKVDLIGEVSSQLFAGFDTTSSALGWTVWLLANQTALQEKLRGRIAAVVGRNEIALDHVAQIPELAGLVHEAMRMFPPVPILSRIAVEADTVSTVSVTPNQKVLLSVIGLHHDSMFWKEPARMAIDRFPHGEVTPEQREHHMAFSAGQRACGGSRFAMIEMPVAIMALLRHVRFSVAIPEPMRFSWSASLRRHGGVRLAVAPA